MSNKKDHIYGVLGSGKAKEKIVLDGLFDAHEQASTFLIHARRNPQGSVTTVYDFLADNEINFIAYHRIDDNPPKALLSLSSGEQKTDDPAMSIITSLKRSGGTLLLLWDEENPESSEKFAIMASNAGVPIKDLTDGLTPIVVEGSDTPEVVEEEKEPIEEPTLAFSREELLNMNIGVLRRQAKALGIDSVGRVTKEEIVDLIMGVEEPVVSSDVHVSPIQLPSELAVITWYENGTMQVAQAPLEMVKSLVS